MNDMSGAFGTRARKGVETTIILAKAIVPAYVAVFLLRTHAGIGVGRVAGRAVASLDWIARRGGGAAHLGHVRQLVRRHRRAWLPSR